MDGWESLPKVGDLEFSLRAEEKILRLDVAVNHMFVVAVAWWGRRVGGWVGGWEQERRYRWVGGWIGT